MRPFKRVKMLNADEYRGLKRAVASRKIAQRPGCKERTAPKWIGRFNRHGVAGLEEVLRSGRPRVHGPEDVGAVLQAALTPPRELGLPFASWTLDGWWRTSRKRRTWAWAGPGSPRAWWRRARGGASRRGGSGRGSIRSSP